MSDEVQGPTGGDDGWPPPPPTAPPPTAERQPVWAAPSAPRANELRPPGWPVPRASVRSVATWCVRLLAVVAVFQVLSAALLWGTDAGRSAMTFGPADAPPTFSTGELLFLLFSVLGSIPSIALVVVFLIWLHRCHLQLAGLRRGEHLPYSAGMAVGCWFIPVVHLWMPLREVRGLYRASSPDPADPDAPPGSVTAWWVALVVIPVAALSVGLFRSTSTVFRDGLGAAPVEPTAGDLALNLLGTVSLLVAAFLAVRLVRELTERVDQRAAEAGLR